MLTACDNTPPYNDPYPKKEILANNFYATFSQRPKTLDPARSYSSDESLFTSAIYEPPLQYHYLKRPYQLSPLTATHVPTPRYYDKEGQLLFNEIDPNIALTVYTIHIKKGIYYQPHPAFAKNSLGKYEYWNLDNTFLDEVNTLSDFPKQGTRELTAEDYVYGIKRLAHPDIHSPILGHMSEYILDLEGYANRLVKIKKTYNQAFFDLRQYNFAGAKVLDRYRYQIILKNKYPQFIYWLAMPFFSPIPWEVDYFYSQPGMKENNLSFDWFPVGTGAYQLIENNPNRQMVLARNPNFHEEFYPAEGNQQDEKIGLLQDKGKRLPFIDQYIFSLETESIPTWNKFLQGFYDRSGISSDSFNEAIQVNSQGLTGLTEKLQKMGIRLQTSVDPSIYYVGFNMLDEVVGGQKEKARKLRQAIAIALDTEEYIEIFLNGRGIVAQGLIPPGIFGYLSGKEGYNPYIYDWKNDRAIRKPLIKAKQLLEEAGYRDGINQETGEPLVLNYDVSGGRGSDERSQFEWMQKQFAKIGIQLNIRSTDYNRFQDKMASGNMQIFSWGWVADYPDPENFLFLLYSPQSRVKAGGENMSNYSNPLYDRLFVKMKNLHDNPIRQNLINSMTKILQRDVPIIGLFHSKLFVLEHGWNGISKPLNVGGSSTLKYRKINPVLRQQKQVEWNRPVVWPLLLMLILSGTIFIPVIVRYWRKENAAPKLYPPSSKCQE